jgi:hypothetical protein
VANFAFLRIYQFWPFFLFNAFDAWQSAAIGVLKNA